MIDQLPIHSVIDSTKLSTYMSCPRQYFYAYLLGWQPSSTSHDLLYGGWVHEAMEVLLRNGYDDESVSHATTLVTRLWLEEYGTDTTIHELYAPKNLATTSRMLYQYAHYYRHDNFDVITVEKSGAIPVDDTHSLHFKMDAIIRDTDHLYYGLEHKTSKYALTEHWCKQWPLRMQLGTYLHVIYSLFPENEVGGIIVNGICLRNPPRTKRDGTPYANSKDNEFLRLKVNRTIPSMESWRNQASTWCRMLVEDTHRCYEESENPKNENAMLSFVMNDTACSNYKGCPYFSLCQARHNPLLHLDRIPSNFTIRHWDPRPTQKEEEEENND